MSNSYETAADELESSMLPQVDGFDEAIHAGSGQHYPPGADFHCKAFTATELGDLFLGLGPHSVPRVNNLLAVNGFLFHRKIWCADSTHVDKGKWVDLAKWECTNAGTKHAVFIRKHIRWKLSVVPLLMPIEPPMEVDDEKRLAFDELVGNPDTLNSVLPPYVNSERDLISSRLFTHRRHVLKGLIASAMVAIILAVFSAYTFTVHHSTHDLMVIKPGVMTAINPKDYISVAPSDGSKVQLPHEKGG